MTSRPIYSAGAPSASRLTPRGENPLLEAAKGRVVTVLRVYFNFLLLNLVLLVASLPVVTVPVAFNAAMVALGALAGGWRGPSRAGVRLRPQV